MTLGQGDQESPVRERHVGRGVHGQEGVPTRNEEVGDDGGRGTRAGHNKSRWYVTTGTHGTGPRGKAPVLVRQDPTPRVAPTGR